MATKKETIGKVLKILSQLTKVDWEYDEKKFLFKWIFHSICVWIKPNYSTKSWDCWIVSNGKLLSQFNHKILEVGRLKEVGLKIIVESLKLREIDFKE